MKIIHSFSCNLLFGAGMLALVGLTSQAAMAQGTPDEQYRALEKEYLTDIRCKDLVWKRLNSLGASGQNGRIRVAHQWSQVFAGNDGSVKLLSPKTLAGMWIQAQVYKNKEVVVSQVTAKHTHTYTYTNDPGLQSCRESVDRKEKEYSEDMAVAFNDHRLIDLLKGYSTGVVYVWSPNMPYGYRAKQAGDHDGDAKLNGLDEMSKAVQLVAAEIGQPVHLEFVLDPTTQTASALAARELMPERFQDMTVFKKMLRKVEAIDIIFRNVGNHYPAALVFSNKEIARRVYPGVGTAEEYKAFILESIKGIAASQGAQ